MMITCSECGTRNRLSLDDQSWKFRCGSCKVIFPALGLSPHDRINVGLAEIQERLSTNDFSLLEKTHHELEEFSKNLLSEFRAASSLSTSECQRIRKKTIGADVAALGIVTGIYKESMELFPKSYQKLQELITHDGYPELNKKILHEVVVVVFALELFTLKRLFNKKQSEALEHMATKFLGELLKVDGKAIREWITTYLKPFGSDLAVPTDPFTPWGLFGVFGDRCDFPKSANSKNPLSILAVDERHINPLTVLFLAASICPMVGRWKKIRLDYSIASTILGES